MSNTSQPDAENAAQAQTDNPAAAGKLSGRSVVLNNAFEIFFDHSMPRMQQPGVKVYQARALRGGNCLAYVSERMVVPRIQTSEKYASLQNAVLCRLLARGVIRCPDGFERYTFVYENSLGQPLVPNKGEPLAYGMKPDLVMNAIIKPMMLALQDIHNADIVHGGIRVDNMFDAGANPVQRVVLGDCLAQSFSAAQPPIYLSPAVAMAMPSGRGLGNASDDMYAFGASLAILLRTRDPMQGKSDRDIQLMKLDLGSFSMLIENERLPSNILELLRGLLQDDLSQRWSIQDVFEWMEGRRVNHRQSMKRLKASRHVVIGTEKILAPSIFAYHAINEPGEVVKLVDSGEIKQWITRSISDARLDDRYETALATSNEYGRGVGFQDRMASRLCTAFEPDFPIMFRTVRLFPDSFGTVLAELISQSQDPKPIADLIGDQAVMFWMNMQNEVPADINLVVNRFEQCQQFLKQRTIGYGLERCLYFLAADVPCLSTKLRGFYVNSPEELLIALNAVADMNDRPEAIFDRHIIAFLSVRERKVIDSYMPDLNASEAYRQISGTINVLANIQGRSKMPPMPALTKWLFTLAEPLYDRFHDRDLRVTMRKKMNDIKEQGVLRKILDILFDSEKYRRDQQEFRLAMREYSLLNVESRQLEEALKDQANFGTQAGREIAALIAGVVMALAVAGLMIAQFSQKGGLPW